MHLDLFGVDVGDGVGDGDGDGSSYSTPEQHSVQRTQDRTTAEVAQCLVSRTLYACPTINISSKRQTLRVSSIGKRSNAVLLL